MWRVLYRTPGGQGYFEDIDAQSAEAAAWRVAMTLESGDFEDVQDLTTAERAVVEGSGQRGERGRLDQAVSVRLDPGLVAALREHARSRGLSLSDVLREASVMLTGYEHAAGQDRK